MEDENIVNGVKGKWVPVSTGDSFILDNYYRFGPKMFRDAFSMPFTKALKIVKISDDGKEGYSSEDIEEVNPMPWTIEEYTERFVPEV